MMGLLLGEVGGEVRGADPVQLIEGSAHCRRFVRTPLPPPEGPVRIQNLLRDIETSIDWRQRKKITGPIARNSLTMSVSMKGPEHLWSANLALSGL